MNDRSLARSLGWFSIALGSAELTGASQLRSAFRAGDPALIRLFGLRETASGLAILALPNPGPGVWARVAGDVLDIAALTSMLRAHRAHRERVAGALVAVAGITVLDVITGVRLSRGPQSSDSSPKKLSIERSITIGRPADQLYSLWSDPATLPRIVGEGISVTVDADGEQHWSAPTVAGRSIEWTATTVANQPDERVAWSTADGASPGASGEARFRAAPGDWGTEVTLRLEVQPPAGASALVNPLGDLIARLGASQMLHRFKSLAETGEIPTLSGQPAARNDGRDR